MCIRIHIYTHIYIYVPTYLPLLSGLAQSSPSRARLPAIQLTQRPSTPDPSLTPLVSLRAATSRARERATLPTPTRCCCCRPPPPPPPPRHPCAPQSTSDSATHPHCRPPVASERARRKPLHLLGRRRRKTQLSQRELNLLSLALSRFSLFPFLAAFYHPAPLFSGRASEKLLECRPVGGWRVGRGSYSAAAAAAAALKTPGARSFQSESPIVRDKNDRADVA